MWFQNESNFQICSIFPGKLPGYIIIPVSQSIRPLKNKGGIPMLFKLVLFSRFTWTLKSETDLKIIVKTMILKSKHSNNVPFALLLKKEEGISDFLTLILSSRLT